MQESLYSVPHTMQCIVGLTSHGTPAQEAQRLLLASTGTCTHTVCTQPCSYTKSKKKKKKDLQRESGTLVSPQLSQARSVSQLCEETSTGPSPAPPGLVMTDSSLSSWLSPKTGSYLLVGCQDSHLRRSGCLSSLLSGLPPRTVV